MFDLYLTKIFSRDFIYLPVILIIVIHINNTVYLKLYKSPHELCFCIPQAQFCFFCALKSPENVGLFR